MRTLVRTRIRAKITLAALLCAAMFFLLSLLSYVLLDAFNLAWRRWVENTGILVLMATVNLLLSGCVACLWLYKGRARYIARFTGTIALVFSIGAVSYISLMDIAMGIWDEIRIVERGGTRYVAKIVSWDSTIVYYYDYHGLFVQGEHARIREGYGKGGFDPFSAQDVHYPDSTAYYDENGVALGDSAFFKIHSGGAEVRHELRFTPIGERPDGDLPMIVYKCEVINGKKRGSIAQTFEIESSFTYEYNFIDFVDMTFDGYADLQVELYRGNSNRTLVFFRYRPDSQTFETSHFFSLLTTGKFDFYPDEKQFIAYAHSSAYSYEREFYQYGEDGNVKLVRYEYAEPVSFGDDWFMRVHIMEIDGDSTVEIYSQDLTNDEYYNVSSQRTDFLRFGEDRDYSVKNHLTGKASDYKLRMSSPNEISLNPVDEWYSDVNGNGYACLIYSDPDSWDVFIAVPDRRAELSALTNDDIGIEIVGDILRVYIAQDNEPHLDAGLPIADKLIHLKAPMRGAWPNRVEVFWNGEALPCIGANYYD
jgi:hypothetical protein